MLEGELLLEEEAAPDHAGHTVGRDDRRGKGDMLAVREGVDVKELAYRLKDGAGVLGRLLPRDQLLLFSSWQHADQKYIRR